MLSKAVRLSKLPQSVRTCSTLTPAQKYFQHEETFATLNKDVRLVRMKHEHIPLVLPVFRDFWNMEITAKSLKIEFGDKHYYPMLFDVTRDPYSFLILKNDELIGHILQYAVYRNKEDDKTILPKTPMNLKKDDKWHIIEEMVEIYEKKAFELKPEMNKMIHSFGIYLHPEYQRNGWMQQTAVHVARENMKLLDKGFTAFMGISSRKTSQVVGRKAGFEVIYTPPVDVYTKLNKGTPLDLVENGEIATLVYFDMKKNLNNPLYKL